MLPQQSRHANDVTCVALSKDVFVWLIFPSDESTPLGSEHACVCDVQLVSAAAALGVGEQLGAAVCNAAADNAAEYSRTSLPAALSAAASGLRVAARGGSVGLHHWRRSGYNTISGLAKVSAVALLADTKHAGWVVAAVVARCVT